MSGSSARTKLGIGFGRKVTVIRIHTLVADVAYAISDRYRVSVSVPFSSGSISKVWADKAIHEQTATGVGDVTLMSEAWVLSPRTNERGNVALALGLKIPTGSHSLGSQFYTATGAVDFPADQTIQPGDGGLAVILQSRGFRRITERTIGYAFVIHGQSQSAK